MTKRAFRIAQVAHLGGIARRERLSAAARSESARHASLAKHRRLTKAERAASARRAAQVRWMRWRQRRRAEKQA
jgi:hypothetical protein